MSKKSFLMVSNLLLLLLLYCPYWPHNKRMFVNWSWVQHNRLKSVMLMYYESMLSYCPLLLSSISLLYCSAETCGPTEALSFTKKPQSSFICSLLPAVFIVAWCSFAAWKNTIGFTSDNVIIIAFESSVSLHSRVGIFLLKSVWLCSEPCFHVPIFGVLSSP